MGNDVGSGSEAKQDEKQVRASAEEAQSLGLEGTPAMFIDGERIPGALPEAQLWVVIDRALRDEGCSSLTRRIGICVCGLLTQERTTQDERMAY